MIPFHPLADVLPLLEGAAFAELVTDIKTNGLREPITLHEDKILDGRNRYRACLEAGIEPPTHVYDGKDPVGFVLSKNIIRRQLTANQKALAMAQYATLKNGHHKVGTSSGVLTEAEAARLAGVSDRTVRDAKVILANGTPAEIAEVKDGKSGIKPMAKKLRKKVSGKRPKVPTAFPSMMAAVRAGVESEHAEGLSRSDAGKKVGLGVKTYMDGRDIVLLLQRDDLSEEDRAIVQRAAHEFDNAGSLRAAGDLVKPIAVKIWGAKGHRTSKGRSEAFIDGVWHVTGACAAARELVVPPLSKGQRKELLTRMREAIAALRWLQLHLKHGGN